MSTVDTNKVIADLADDRNRLQSQLTAAEQERDSKSKQLMEHGEALSILAQLRALYNCSSDMRTEPTKSAAQLMMKQGEEGLRVAHERRMQEQAESLRYKLAAAEQELAVEKEKSRWIPVEERLPDMGQITLVLLESGNIVQATSCDWNMPWKEAPTHWRKITLPKGE